MMKPITYFYINPQEQTVTSRREVVSHQLLCERLGCPGVEARSISSGHIMWFDESEVARGVPLDTFVLDGIDVAGSHAVITGPELDGKLTDCARAATNSGDQVCAWWM